MASQIHALMRNRVVLGFWALIMVSYCVSQLHGPRAQSQGVLYEIVLCTVSCLILLASFLGSTLLVLSIQIMSQKNKAVLGEHRLTISDEGLVESTLYNESMHKWMGYHKTLSTSTYLMIYPTDGRFFYISKRRPLIEGDMAAFEAALRERTKK